MENNTFGNDSTQPQEPEAQSPVPPTQPQTGQAQQSQPYNMNPAPVQQPINTSVNQQQSGPTQQPQQQNQQPQAHQSDTYGIISIIMAFFIPFIGFILGLIGRSKAKKGGYSGTLSLVGIIMNAVFMVFGVLVFIFVILASFQGVQTVARDTEALNNTNSIYQKVEEFYNNNSYYPEELKLEDFAGIDPIAFNTFVGDSSYRYVPSSCVQNKCQSYVLSVELETENSRGEKVYERRSLN